MQTAPLMIVSDVDGTLLDESGAWPAPPRVLRARLQRVAQVRETPVTLALASSRTLDELLALQRWLGWSGPCIAEDGALIAIDDDTAGEARRALARVDITSPDVRRSGRRTLLVVRLGDHAARLRELLSVWPAAQSADVARAEPRRLAQLGFGSPSRRRRALTARHASVLLDLRIDVSDALVPNTVVTDTVVTDTVVTDDSVGVDIDVDIVRGGRWSTATRGAGKGNALRWLRRIVDTHAPVPYHVIGIGNGENDQSLLEASDTRFAVRSNSARALRALGDVPRVIMLQSPGTRAWLDMLDYVASESWEVPL